MTKTSNKTNDKTSWVINNFTYSFIAVEPRLKKSQLVLSATGDELNLGSLDWMDVITQLESAFNISIETKGLFGANVLKLLYACTRPLIDQKRLTSAEEIEIIQQYGDTIGIVPKLKRPQVVVSTKANQKTK